MGNQFIPANVVMLPETGVSSVICCQKYSVRFPLNALPWDGGDELLSSTGFKVKVAPEGIARIQKWMQENPKPAKRYFVVPVQYKHNACCQQKQKENACANCGKEIVIYGSYASAATEFIFSITDTRKSCCEQLNEDCCGPSAPCVCCPTKLYLDPRELTVTGFSISDHKQGVALIDPNTPPGAPPQWQQPVPMEMFERAIATGKIAVSS